MEILNENLATIAGIHAADGFLGKKNHYIIKDEDINNLTIFSNLVKVEFGFLPEIKKTNKENSYLIQFFNKKISLFLNRELEFPLGPKTYTTGIPKKIEGNKILEMAFLRGALTFESSVNTNRSIVFSVTSKKFRDDLLRVLEEEKIKIKTSERTKKGNRKTQYVLSTSERENLELWIPYYLEGSEKWFKLIELSNGFFGKVSNIKHRKEAFNKTYSKGRNIKTIELIELIQNFKQTDINYIYKKLKIGKTTLTKYLRILKTANIIEREKKLPKINFENLSKNTHITLEKGIRKKMFNNINSYIGQDTKICRLLKVKDYIYCRWKNGERGIQLGTLKNLMKLSRIKERDLKIETIDRDIIIFNKDVSKWRVP